MKDLATKEELIEKVIEQVEFDLDCGYKETVEALIEDIPVDHLINFLPEEEWKTFKHLREKKENKISLKII